MKTTLACFAGVIIASLLAIATPAQGEPKEVKDGKPVACLTWKAVPGNEYAICLDGRRPVVLWNPVSLKATDPTTGRDHTIIIGWR